MNTINTLRMEMGLSRPEMLEHIGAKVGRLSLLHLEDADIDDAFIKAAKALRERYTEWQNMLLDKLDRYAELGVHSLTSSEVQDLTGLRDLHIARLRGRGGVFEAERCGHQYLYSITGLRKLIQRGNALSADSERNQTRGPLAFGFIRWLGRGERDGILLDRTSPDRLATINPSAAREPVAV